MIIAVSALFASCEDLGIVVPGVGGVDPANCNHVEVIDSAKPSTCTETGLTEGKHCSLCKTVLVPQNTIPALGHISGEWKLGSNPTCTENGANIVECVMCNTVVATSPIEALGHSMLACEAKDPTCAEVGYNAHEYCSREGCGYTTRVDIPSLPHTPVQYEGKAATCTEDGYAPYEACVNCSYTTYEVIESTGHSLHIDAAVPADCVNDGLSEGKRCTGCNEVFSIQEIVPAIGHDYAVTTLSPTCEKDGSALYVCKRADCGKCDEHENAADISSRSVTCEACNYSYLTTADEDVSLKATGHGTYTWITVASEGKNICTDGAEKIFICTRCQNHTDESCRECTDMILERKNSSPLGHTPTSDWTLTTAPTLETEGLITGTCNTCVQSGVSVTLPVLGSEEYDKVTDTAPDCSTHGKDTYTISIGGWTGSFDVVTKVSHMLNGVAMDNDKIFTAEDGVVASGNVPTSCKGTGYGVYTCDICNKIQIVTMKGVCNKSELELIESKSYSATCYRVGMEIYYCPTCESEYTVRLPKTSHQFSKYKLIEGNGANSYVILYCENEGCTEDTTYECTDLRIATGETKTKAPTCDEPGYITYEIKKVGESIYTELPRVELDAIGHNYNGNPYDGSKVYTYAELCDIFGSELTGFSWAGGILPKDCKTEGMGVTVCSDCGATIILTATMDHTLVKGNTVAPTCTERGYTEYTCSACGITVKKDYTDVLGHDWKIDTANSTLKEISPDVFEGTLVFVCAYDGTHKDSVKPTNIKEYVIEATCLSDGKRWIEYDYIDPDTGLSVHGSKDIEVLKNPAGCHEYYGAKVNTSISWNVADLKAIFVSNPTDLSFYNGEPGNCLVSHAAVFTCTICNKIQIIFDVSGDHAWVSGECSHCHKKKES